MNTEEKNSRRPHWHRAFRRMPAYAVISFFSLVTRHSSLVTEAQAAVSQSDNRRLEAAETNQGGGLVTSATSGNRQRISLGSPFSGGKVSGSRFRLQAGFLSTALGSRRKPPVDQLDLTVVTAKTEPFGIDLSQRLWQQDADPIFLWEPPAGGLDLAGYSYALDADPDETVDTTATSWDVARDPRRQLVDGQHTFKVKAVNTAGQSGKAAAFELWVDATAPVIQEALPAPGSLINTLSPTITATLVEPHSGINPSGIILSINGASARVSYDERQGLMTASGSGLIQEGTNRLELRLTDRAGNTQTPLVWSVTADATPPSGTVQINGGASTTTSIYVTLNLSASDRGSGVTRMWLGNDPLIGYVEEPFATVRELWRLTAVRGVQRVYVKFLDGAGNISEPVSDEIDLDLLAPETLILSGPAGATQDRTAEFTFTCPEGGCVFAYAFDHQEWSEWSAETTVRQTDLVFGNHYFKVKAAKESNGSPGIQPDEEDPTPAERTWIVGVEMPVILAPRGSPIRLWRLE